MNASIQVTEIGVSKSSEIIRNGPFEIMIKVF
jgi:hypothetical protein